MSAAGKSKLITFGLAAIAIYISTEFFYSTIFSQSVGYFKTALIGTAILIVAAGALLEKEVNIYFSFADILWILMIGFFITRITAVDNNVFLDYIFYLLCGVLLIVSKYSYKNYSVAVKLLVFAAVFYSAGVFIQYFFTDFWSNHIVTIYGTARQAILNKLMRDGAYAGFTTQVGFTAGFLSTGIGIVFFKYYLPGKTHGSKALNLIFLVIFFAALLLTMKRAHLLFSVVALIFTAFVPRNKGKNIVKMLLTICAVFALMFIVYSILGLKDNENAFVRLMDTFMGFSKGEDVSNNRFKLYSVAWDMFLKKPVFGNGWRYFLTTLPSVQDTTSTTATHNVFLQLLCETGIIGCSLCVSVIGAFFFSTIKIIKIRLEKFSWAEQMTVMISLYLQTFFIFYCFTGNPFYDKQFLLTYVLACCMSQSVIYIKAARKADAGADPGNGQDMAV